MRLRAVPIKSVFLALLFAMFFLGVYKMLSHTSNLHTRMTEIEESPFPRKSETISGGAIGNDQSVNKNFIRGKIHTGEQSDPLTVTGDLSTPPPIPTFAPQISSELDAEKMPTDVEERPKEEFYYSIHLGSFKSLANAKERIELLSIKGLPAWLEKVNIVGKGEWFRVYIGKYKTKAEALSICETLKSTGINDKSYIHKLGSMNNLKVE